MDNYARITQIEMTEKERELRGELKFSKAFSDAMGDLFNRVSKEESIKAQMLENLGKLSEERAPIDNPNKISHEEAVKKIEEKAKKEPTSFSL